MPYYYLIMCMYVWMTLKCSISVMYCPSVVCRGTPETWQENYVGLVDTMLAIRYAHTYVCTFMSH